MDSDRTPDIQIQIGEQKPMDDLRIVLFGSDNPKSQLIRIIEAAGRFINDSQNNPPPEGGAQQENQCQKYSRNINDKNVVIIDTPGLYIYGKDKKKVLEEIKWSVAVAKPGPHVFLLVETIYKEFGKNLEALEDFQKTFGEQANDFTMVVFTTDKNDKKNIQHLRKLTYPFNHRHFIFNTEGDERQQQVTDLLGKVAEMKREAFYTPKMLWEAEKALKKQEEEKQKQEEERQRKIWNRRFVFGAQGGATIASLFRGSLKLELATAAGVGSVCGVIVTFIVYLIFSGFKKKK